MIAINSQKIAMAALLAGILSAPLAASEIAATTQQSAVGETAREIAAAPGAPTAARESLQVPTHARVAPTAAPGKVDGAPARKVAALSPTVMPGRGVYAFTPLILGIGY